MGKAARKVRDSGRLSGLNEFVRLFRSMVDPYRPELHYMRGPGPKWHAKHARTVNDAPAISGLARIEG